LFSTEIKLKKEVRKSIIDDIKVYFYKERNEEINDLGAELLLDFIIQNVGPHIYNHAINDAYTYMNEKIEDLIGLEKRFR
jgi:uncharacterized protein (DUF2164 family)